MPRSILGGEKEPVERGVRRKPPIYESLDSRKHVHVDAGRCFLQCHARAEIVRLGVSLVVVVSRPSYDFV